MTKHKLQTGHAGLTFSGKKKREKKKPSPDLIFESCHEMENGGKK